MYFPTYQQIEDILKIAVKLPSMSIKYTAQETGLNAKGLYAWSSGASHLGPQRADIIINWLNECRPDVLPAAIKAYNKKVIAYEL